MASTLTSFRDNALSIMIEAAIKLLKENGYIVIKEKEEYFKAMKEDQRKWMCSWCNTTYVDRKDLCESVFEDPIDQTNGFSLGKCKGCCVFNTTNCSFGCKTEE